MLSVAALISIVAIGIWALEEQDPHGVPAVELDDSRPRPQGDYYVVTVPQGPTNLNPFTTSDVVARRSVLSYTHDALLKIDPISGEEIPSLASRVDRGADGQTFTVHLRDGARFSDGSPLTMRDVWFTWELAQANLSGSMWTGLKLIERLEPVDDRSFRIVLGEAHFAAMGTVMTSFTVASRAFFEGEVRRLAEEAGQPVPTDPADEAFVKRILEIVHSGPGTGPYQVARDVETGALMWRDDHVTLVQNPYSWRIESHPDYFNLAGIKILVVSDIVQMRALLRTQGVDWFADPDPEELLESRPEQAKYYRAMEYEYANLGPVFVVWNHRHPALGDPRVREALSLLFDRDQILALRGSQAAPINSWFLPGTPRAGDDPPFAFDVERARTLLVEAGFDSLELSLLTIEPQEWQELVDLAIPAFAQAGVTLRKEVVHDTVLGKRLSDREFEGLLWAWWPDVYNDPTEIFHSTLAEHNWMGYASGEMDRVLEAARSELDRDARVVAYREFNRVFREDHPITLLYHRRSTGLLHRRFQNVEIGAKGLSPRGWWVEPGDQLRQWGTR